MDISNVIAEFEKVAGPRLDRLSAYAGDVRDKAFGVRTKEFSKAEWNAALKAVKRDPALSAKLMQSRTFALDDLPVSRTRLIRNKNLIRALGGVGLGLGGGVAAATGLGLSPHFGGRALVVATALLGRGVAGAASDKDVLRNFVAHEKLRDAVRAKGMRRLGKAGLIGAGAIGAGLLAKKFLGKEKTAGLGSFLRAARDKKLIMRLLKKDLGTASERAVRRGAASKLRLGGDRSGLGKLLLGSKIKVDPIPGNPGKFKLTFPATQEVDAWALRAMGLPVKA